MDLPHHIKYLTDNSKTDFQMFLVVVCIRESVDSLCRDGSNIPIVRVHWKTFLTREHSRFKPFSAR